MSTFKKCQVVMLSSNEKANLYITGNNTLYNYSKGVNREPLNCRNHHLYIISDDEIKEGDYFLSNLNEILKCTKREDNFVWYEKLIVPDVSKVAQPFSIHINLKSKKIIATTDKSLKLEIDGSRGNLLPDVSFDIELPQPSQSFIQKYVEEYNKRNQIVDLLVEYEYRHDDSVPYPKTLDGESVLKVNPKDNTITIKKVKDSWSRDEIEEIHVSVVKQGCLYEGGKWSTIHERLVREEFNKWADQNL